MLIARIRSNPGLVAGFLAQALQYGAGLILMPFVVSRLSVAEVGIWYVFLAAQSLAAVADFGFQPTLARFFSLARSGVAQITRDGMGAPGNGQPNLPLTRSLLGAARRLYLILALSAFLLLAAGGTFYVASLARNGGLAVESVCAAWWLFALAVAANLYFLWIPAFLLGSGKIAANYGFLILSRGGFALFGIVVLLAGGGLLALAIGFLASQFAARLLATVFLRGTAAADKLPPSTGEARTVFAAIWPNASKLGLVGVGAFLITRYNVFLLSSTIGLEQSARYAICLQIFSGIASVAQLPAQAGLSHIVDARVANDSHRFQRLVLGTAGFYLVLFVTAATIVVVAGTSLLHMIGSKVELLDPALLILFAAIIALEGFHSLAAFIITTRNAVPFVIPGLVSGAAVAITSTAAVHFGYGILGVLCCQGVVQLMYNNWKWPLMVYRDFDR